MGSRRIAALGAGLVLAVVPVAAAQRSDDPPPSKAAGERLVYADFEAPRGKAVSARGGTVTLTSYQESDLQKTTTKGAPDGGNAPELVRIKPDDPNHLAKFDFAFKAPNQWAGAGFEIKGQPDVDGKTGFDDVSGYKKLTFQLYGKGVESVRVEAISRGYGVDLPSGYPQMLIQGAPGPQHLRGRAQGSGPAAVGRLQDRNEEDPGEADVGQHHGDLRELPPERGHAHRRQRRVREIAGGRPASRRGQRPLLS